MGKHVTALIAKPWPYRCAWPCQLVVLADHNHCLAAL